MTVRALAVSLSVGAMGVFTGCLSGGVGTASLSVDAGVVPTVAVSGMVRVYPPAAAFLAAHGQQGPTLSGHTLTLEEPLGLALKDPDAALGDQAVGGNGAFSFPKVRTDAMNRLLAANTHDTGVAASTSVLASNVASALYDAAVYGQAPRDDVTGLKAELVPSAFVSALETAVTSDTIKRLTQGSQTTLLGAGFVVGAVVDSSGVPKAGEKVVTDDPTLQAQLCYPAADFGSVGTAGTSATGLFVFVHNGTGTMPFSLQVAGDTTYTARNALATPGSGLVVKLYPGTKEP